jgi:hypothetical protein
MTLIARGSVASTGNPLDALRGELRGKHLACCSRLPQHGEVDIGHAAILVRIANLRSRHPRG